VEKTAAWLIKKAIKIGPQCGAWADAVILNRGVEGIRSLYGLRLFWECFVVVAAASVLIALFHFLPNRHDDPARGAIGDATDAVRRR